MNLVIQKSTPKILTIDAIRTATSADRDLVDLQKAIETGNFDATNTTKEYKKLQYELCVQDGIILRNHRIIIPKTLRPHVISLAYKGHLVIIKVKQQLRTKCYWINMDTGIEEAVRNCQQSQELSPPNKALPINYTELPTSPWQYIGADLYGPTPDGKKLLVIIDYFIRYPVVKIMTTITAISVINQLDKIFAIHGFPNSVLTDNGPPWNSSAIKNYFKQRGIKHKRITPL